MKPIQIIGALPYQEVRERCHQLKEGSEDVVEKEAVRFAGELLRLWEKILLVPVPGHDGFSGYTNKLAQRIAELCRHHFLPAVYLDVLRAIPHESFNERKHQGYQPQDGDIIIRWLTKGSDMIFNLNKSLGYMPVLVDNVVDSGVTARACMKVIGECPVLCTGFTGNCETIFFAGGTFRQ